MIKILVIGWAFVAPGGFYIIGSYYSARSASYFATRYMWVFDFILKFFKKTTLIELDETKNFSLIVTMTSRGYDSADLDLIDALGKAEKPKKTTFLRICDFAYGK